MLTSLIFSSFNATPYRNITVGLFVLLLRFQIWKLEMFWNKNGIYLLGGEHGHI